MQPEEILAKIRERIVAFAASRLSRAVAEDLAQEVLIILHEKYGDVTDPAELLPLSFQVLRFKMLNFYRRSSRRGEQDQIPIEDLPVPDPAGDPETDLANKQAIERLIRALKKLSPRCRQLFCWKLQGKSFAEIQALFGQRSINTIYTWDFRCRKDLLRLMGGSWEERERIE